MYCGGDWLNKSGAASFELQAASQIHVDYREKAHNS
jgi:hypothetical protein